MDFKLLVLVTLLAACAAQDFTASHLRCEHVENPIGITEAAPRLSWWATLLPSASASTNQSVTSYEIIVASSSASVMKGVGDMWDTGRVSVQPV